jgi:predicted carbohydrate-binding protein with CBM5 and CBM33 domain
MKFSNIALTIVSLSFTSAAFSHGFIESPPSRAFNCKLGVNTTCGSVQYEPQSVEQLSGFPSSLRPEDGKLASASIGNYSQLDRQSINAWGKTAIKPGMNKFVWYHTAPHRTTNWRYYITKQNWDPNKPLSRAQFDLTPFCMVEGGGIAPAMRATHNCQVPERTGYQVIYGVWQIADTANSFYQVIDVNFGGDTASKETIASSEWSKVLNGQIIGSTLKQGDKVSARFFDARGEITAMQTSLVIANAAQGEANQWAHDLAEKLNNTRSYLRAGIMDNKGSINPVYGANQVYVRKGSALESVAISYETRNVQVKETLKVSGVQYSRVTNGKATVRFNVSVSGNVNVTAYVMDHYGSEKGYIKQDINNRSQELTLNLSNVTAGHHQLKYYATNSEGTLFAQDVIPVNLSDSASGSAGKYDYKFPDGIRSYKAGTVVLQPKNGKMYECKPFPYSGYCVQWSKYAVQFEPGVGSHWKEAWILKD